MNFNSDVLWPEEPGMLAFLAPWSRDVAREPALNYLLWEPEASVARTGAKKRRGSMYKPRFVEVEPDAEPTEDPGQNQRTAPVLSVPSARPDLITIAPNPRKVDMPGAIQTANFRAVRQKYQAYLVNRVLFIIILIFVPYILHVALGFYLFLFEN